ncbi:MAG: superoxide dismutase family protein, partial [Gammaproteobacteria bacterium]
GEDRGFVALTELPHGIILQADLSGLAPGKHAFHLHETARCEAPDFTSAGGHFAPRDRSHGYLSGSGHHAGDLPNQIVDADGELLVSLYAAELRLRTGASALLDEDGSALVIHQGRDDYASQPSGAAGPRVACAALAPGLLSAAHGD